MRKIIYTGTEPATMSVDNFKVWVKNLLEIKLKLKPKDVKIERFKRLPYPAQWFQVICSLEIGEEEKILKYFISEIELSFSFQEGQRTECCLKLDYRHYKEGSNGMRMFDESGDELGIQLPAITLTD